MKLALGNCAHRLMRASLKTQAWLNCGHARVLAAQPRRIVRLRFLQHILYRCRKSIHIGLCRIP